MQLASRLILLSTLCTSGACATDGAPEIDTGPRLSVGDAGPSFDAAGRSADSGSADSGSADSGSADSGSIDEGIDQGQLAGRFEPCDDETLCDESLACETEFPNPFCTDRCRQDTDCWFGFCHAGLCRPYCERGGNDCQRFGGACAHGDESGLCVPTCSTEEGYECESLACDVYGGCVAETWGGRDEGDPCELGTDCRGQICFREEMGFPGGYCSGLGRVTGPSSTLPWPQGDCPEGALVVDLFDEPVEGNAGFCLARCGDGCRPGYECRGRPSSSFCWPRICDIGTGFGCEAGTRCEPVPTDPDLGSCHSCEPECTGRRCGDDGCGGTCGTCDIGDVCREGYCECVPASDEEICRDASASCGTVTVSDCGESRTISCGTCDEPETCGALNPNECGCTPETDDEFCASRGAECGNTSGRDRCDRFRSVNCGTCGSGERCASAVCEACTPSCGTRECGSDGCGGSCGGCPSGDACGVSGRCSFVTSCDPVRNTVCEGNDKCALDNFEQPFCVPEGPRSEGSSCTVSNDCRAGLACLDFGSGGVCTPLCRLSTGSGCGFSQTCMNVISSYRTYGACI